MTFRRLNNHTAVGRIYLTNKAFLNLLMHNDLGNFFITSVGRKLSAFPGDAFFSILSMKLNFRGKIDL